MDDKTAAMIQALQSPSGYTMNNFQNDIYNQQMQNEYRDKTQNQNQGPTPLNLSNVNYAKKNGEMPIWNGPTGQRQQAIGYPIEDFNKILQQHLLLQQIQNSTPVQGGNNLPYSMPSTLVPGGGQ